MTKFLVNRDGLPKPRGPKEQAFFVECQQSTCQKKVTGYRQQSTCQVGAVKSQLRWSRVAVYGPGGPSAHRGPGRRAHEKRAPWTRVCSTPNDGCCLTRTAGGRTLPGASATTTNNVLDLQAPAPLGHVRLHQSRRGLEWIQSPPSQK